MARLQDRQLWFGAGFQGEQGPESKCELSRCPVICQAWPQELRQKVFGVGHVGAKEFSLGTPTASLGDIRLAPPTL